jgi:hypothetical protein
LPPGFRHFHGFSFTARFFAASFRLTSSISFHIFYFLSFLLQDSGLLAFAGYTEGLIFSFHQPDFPLNATE